MNNNNPPLTQISQVFRTLCEVSVNVDTTKNILGTSITVLCR